MENRSNFAIGMVWGIGLSVPLWISLIGWTYLIVRLWK